MRFSTYFSDSGCGVGPHISQTVDVGTVLETRQQQSVAIHRCMLPYDMVRFIVCSFTKGPPRDDMRVTAEPSAGDVEIGLHAVSEGEPTIPGSNASTMSTVSSCAGHDSNDSSEIGMDEQSMKEYELVRSVLYATRDNVNIVHEVFRQVRIRLACLFK